MYIWPPPALFPYVGCIYQIPINFCEEIHRKFINMHKLSRQTHQDVSDTPTKVPTRTMPLLLRRSWTNSFLHCELRAKTCSKSSDMKTSWPIIHTSSQRVSVQSQVPRYPQPSATRYQQNRDTQKTQYHENGCQQGSTCTRNLCSYSTVGCGWIYLPRC